MQTEYGISPGPEHFASIVDLLSRVGELEEANEILKLEPYNSSACLMVIEMYSLAGKWKEVAEMRRHMQRERESKKELGSSFIDVKGKIHLFTTAQDFMSSTVYLISTFGLMGCQRGQNPSPKSEHVDEKQTSFEMQCSFVCN
nr:pentatricopeptide repeat-containing protein At4g02750-like [Ipomoea batatas]GME13710.1 pentatricopeptide repeat-containing protein At4g02750-like [Ipomoea batatas]